MVENLIGFGLLSRGVFYCHGALSSFKKVWTLFWS